jgi:valyl-tRNA synthetase
MQKRYEQWVQGLNQDWCISRQRYFGVPFPVWYPLDAQGCVIYDQPILATTDQLPVDPSKDIPPGYTNAERDQAYGFTADPDVMDTWATSALTPLINSHWLSDEKRHQQLYPADLRTQAHEIIRTWAFYSITKCWLHTGKLPWHTIAISGWVVNPDHSKMSKSKGAKVTPEQLLEQYPTDALRYWAGRAKLGQDTVYDPSVFNIGQKLINKIFNVSKFILMQINQCDTAPDQQAINQTLDLAWQASIQKLINQVTPWMQQNDYASALIAIEEKFWQFCDYFVELTKTRAYQGETTAKASAIATLRFSLDTFLHLFAPFLPHITEEIWQALPHHTKPTSIHLEPWPNAQTPDTDHKLEQSMGMAITVIDAIRTEKAKQQKSLKWPIKSLDITANKASIQAIQAIEADLITTGHVEDNGITYATHEDDACVITVTLADTGKP